MSNIVKKVSIRNLVEFILREGDIESGSSGARDPEVMQEGIRIHKHLQKRGGADYRAEVNMSVEKTLIYDNYPVTIKIEGRADGVIENDDDITINEIKSMYSDVTRLEKAYNVHLAQAKCYAAIYCITNNVPEIKVRMTYCQIETMLIKEFEESFSSSEITEWFDSLVFSYAKWVVWECKWEEERDARIKQMKFPFEYREGQFELVKNVYISILRGKNLFLQAPTGVGKTISTVFPAVAGMGQEKVSKIFYLTAKTITRTVAEDTFNMLIDKGLKLKVVTITAKEKICAIDKPECNPAACERAKGHYDRVNDAIYDLLTNEESISRSKIEEYAAKHNVCPFEMCLDVTMWSDAVICDYNYVFDPTVYLKRYFAENSKDDYVFLIDESHNLVDRARGMYTARLSKGLVTDVRASVKNFDKKLYKALDSVNTSLLEYKRQCDEYMLMDNVGNLILKVIRALSAYDDFLKDILPKTPEYGNTDDLMQLFFDLRFFSAIFDIMNEKYRIYADYSEKGDFRVTLNCMDPSDNLRDCLKKGRAAVFFSATLLPVKYYMEQLGAGKDDYAIYAKSSFKSEQQLVMAATDVSTKYTRRNDREYARIAEYITKFTGAKSGNYMVFFPSYKMLTDIMEHLPDGENIEYIVQHRNMNEDDKEKFLESFSTVTENIKIGLCVMGGVFGEGIDLREDMLIGAVIVGTGLPMVSNERQLYKDYYDEYNKRGFDYAYLYPGMNKVLQAAGRVIRTASDKGSILLLDERFAQRSYTSLFPREWVDVKHVNLSNIENILEKFWEK